MRRFFLLAGLGAALLVPAARIGAQDSGEYRLGPKDLISIMVFQVPELNLERRVGESGSIDLPLIGELPVGGLTATEVQDRLAAMLMAKYVHRADVSVTVKEFANKPIWVLGAVGHPGALGIAGRWKLAEAISAAGGVAQGAGRKVLVHRTAENGVAETLSINLADLMEGSSAIWNIPILPADTITIPNRTTVRVFLLGEVKQSGAQEFDSDETLTLLTVIAKAGGLTDRASHTLRVKRRGKDGRSVETVYSYNRILAGKDPDPELLPDDIVLIKEAFL